MLGVICKLVAMNGWPAFGRPARGAAAGLRRARTLSGNPAKFFEDSETPGEVFRALGDFFELSETPGRAAIHGLASKILEIRPAASRSIGFS